MQYWVCILPETLVDFSEFRNNVRDPGDGYKVNILQKKTK